MSVAEIAVLIGAAVTPILGGMVWLGRMIERYARSVRDLTRDLAQETKRNYVHHGLIFDALNVSRETVRKAEAEAGLARRP